MRKRRHQPASTPTPALEAALAAAAAALASAGGVGVLQQPHGVGADAERLEGALRGGGRAERGEGGQRRGSAAPGRPAAAAAAHHAGLEAGPERRVQREARVGRRGQAQRDHPEVGVDPGEAFAERWGGGSRSSACSSFLVRRQQGVVRRSAHLRVKGAGMRAGGGE